jgi:hypothetical protein
MFAVVHGKLKEYISSFSCSWVLVWAATRRMQMPTSTTMPDSSSYS